ncbi:MAG TPA: flagellar hook-associated protein FlgK [archaeon]|nr:flagellar hook-associated protein FlgK [archaeon]
MPTLNNAINVGLSGLMANQMGLNVTGQNIANVNTEGYSRQRAVFEANKPILLGGHVFGTGVNLLDVVRTRDQFVDTQYRNENKLLGYMEKKAESMDLIEGIINEPSDTGLHNSIKNFFNSLQDLATNPESSSVRTTVREQGRTLAIMFNQVWNQLDNISENKNAEIYDKVSEINGILEQVGSLNLQISTTEALGAKANDLRDNRDRLLDSLSKLVDMSAYEDPANGSTTVSLSGQSFVVIDKVNLLRAESTNQDGKEVIRVINPIDNNPIKISAGELHGLLEIRDSIIPKLQQQIDELASGIINEVNEVHRQGYGLLGIRSTQPTKIDFFKGTDARTMKLSSQIENDPNNIAASKTGAPGDNTNALELAQLRGKKVLNNESFTFEDYYGGLISTFGLETVSVQEKLANQQILVEHFNNFRETISGVNMDEELINLIRFQKAFGANARVLTTVSEMMDIIIQLGRY